jgi:hypothetical protein
LLAAKTPGANSEVAMTTVAVTASAAPSARKNRFSDVGFPAFPLRE